ncbi:MAG: hypothetical protein K0U74_11980 [Alphaproteobacteria bacterium]|nr:hypothetical protein [Alphaproteobacteria bacterium]
MMKKSPTRSPLRTPAKKKRPDRDQAIKDICTPLHVQKVKVVWNETTARVLHEKLGIPFEQLPDEAKPFIKPDAETLAKKAEN